MNIRGKKHKTKFMNRVIIGLGYGLVQTRDLILNADQGINPQYAMDGLSNWIGRELMKGMLDQKVVKINDSNEKLVDSLTKVIDLADDLNITVDKSKINIIVQKCRICPKRIGGYNLEGNTACPIGGILSGALSYAHGNVNMISKNHLQTGEICHIDVDLDK
jgi:hypothetical protein